MRAPTDLRPRALALIVACAGILACGDEPAGPDSELNPALIEEANGAGLGSGLGADLPQGAAEFTGAGGVPLDATAEEFIQQATLLDGTVLRTSGVGIHAVAKSSASGTAYDRLSFAAASTGSLASVAAGSYDIDEPPPIDFINPVKLAVASVRPAGERDRRYATEGRFVIQSLDYFDDVYTCELEIRSLAVDRCDYQIGVVSGTIEFMATLADGTAIVQERTSFTLPIRRRTIIGRFR